MPTDTLIPVAGDPAQVHAAGRTLSSIAVEIADTASKLRALAGANNTGADVGWTGQAAVKAYARTISLPPKLDRAHTSYAAAGTALLEYASQLADAQAESAAAIRAVNSAEADLTHATAAKAAAAASDAQQAAAATAASQPPPPPIAPRYDATIEVALERIGRAKAANTAAHEQQARAASRAAAALKHASHDGIANKKWWQKAISTAAHWADVAWTNSLRFVSTYAAQISAVTGLIALALSVAGLVFPPLEIAAGVFEAASASFGALAAVSDLALAATGKTSWANVGWDALALLPAGAGKITRKFAPKLRETKAVKAVRSRLWSGSDAATFAPSSVPKWRVNGEELLPSDASNKHLLNEYLYQRSEYGEAQHVVLPDGRIRFYDVIDPPRRAGSMAGRRMVREWNPQTGAKRTWHETLDHSDRVRSVRPERPGPKKHYIFDENGNFEGLR